MNQQDSVRYQVANIVQDLSEQGLIETLPRMDCELIGRAVQDQLRPRVVRIQEELEALPVGALARNDHGEYCIRREDGWALVNQSGTRTVTMWLPATVIHLPEEKP